MKNLLMFLIFLWSASVAQSNTVTSIQIDDDDLQAIKSGNLDEWLFVLEKHKFDVQCSASYPSGDVAVAETPEGQGLVIFSRSRSGKYTTWCSNFRVYQQGQQVHALTEYGNPSSPYMGYVLVHGRNKITVGHARYFEFQEQAKYTIRCWAGNENSDKISCRGVYRFQKGHKSHNTEKIER